MRPLGLLRRNESGFMMIEAVIALVLFAIVGTALIGLLTASISANSYARERTIAEQIVNDQVEWIRTKSYDVVGTTAGNPAGIVDPTGLKCPTPTAACDANPVSLRGIDANVKTEIRYVNDPAPTSYATQANYKKVTVSIERARDGKQLARAVTYVSPPARAPLGGINNGIINATVVDEGNSTLPGVGDVTVGLTSSNPFVNSSDTTSETGLVSFAALLPSPSSSDYYKLAVTPPSGYVVNKRDDIAQSPTSAAARVSLAPGQTWTTGLRIYLPSTIHVVLMDSNGTAITTDDVEWGNRRVRVKLTGPGSGSESTTETFLCPGSSASYTCSDNGLLVVSKIQGELVRPGDYTVLASTFPSTPTSQYVPTSYPTDLQSGYTLVIPTKTMSVTIKKGPNPGTNLAPATLVTLSVTGGALWAGGDPAVYSYSGRVDGIPSFTLPVGGAANYTVKAFLGTTCSGTLANSRQTGLTLSAAAAPTSLTVVLTSSGCPSLP